MSLNRRLHSLAARPSLLAILSRACSAVVERHPGLVLFAIAVATRCALFGNPVAHVDDQFYLLVGDRMLHGAIPYVDIWDRKPIGLFLIYAAIRLLGGDGFLQYQLVATIFAWLTAIVVRRLALRLAPAPAATAAAALYLITLTTLNGASGQAPVFYNMLTALAALSVVRVFEHKGRGRSAVLAMLLMGLAIQVKYTVLFEGLFFGIALLAFRRREGATTGQLLGSAFGWAMLGVAPTLAAWAFYAAVGHGGAFAFANFSSIALRHPETGHLPLLRLCAMLLKLSVLAVLGLLSWRRMAGRRSDVVRFLYSWAPAASAGILLFGTYYEHYALPLLLPLTIVAAPILADSGARLGGPHVSLHGLPVVLLLESILGFTLMSHDVAWHSDGRPIPAIAAYIRAHDGGRCPFIFDGEPILYHLSNACLPTRWPFPDHLNNAMEEGAIGVDPVAETARIMAALPPVVVIAAEPLPGHNPRTLALVRRVLASRYRLGAAWQVGARVDQVYLLHRAA